MADVIGRRNFSNARSSRIVQNVLPTIILVDENINDAGFLAFFSKVSKEMTPQEKFTWDVDSFLNLTDTTSAAVSSTTATTIPVSNSTRYIPGQLWANQRTGEIFYVKEVNTGTGNLTVTRAVTALNSSGGTAAATMNSGDTLVRIAPAVGETSSRQITQTTTPTEVFNYCQQFRWEMSMSRRQLKRQYENGDELPYQTKKQMKEAQKQLNAAFLVGEKARYTDSEGQDVTLTGGIKNVPSTYTWSVGGTMHEYEFDEFLVEEGLRKGSRNKMVFASTNFILAISEMTKDRVEYSLNLGTKKAPVGIEVMEYKAPNGGKVMIVEDRFLSEAYNGTAIGVDMSQVKRKVFSRNGFDDDLHIISNTEDPDDLGTVSTLYGDMGLQWGAEENHFLITNVEGGAKGRAVV
jgi:hypothetical protein